MGIKKDEEYFPRGRPASSKPALRRAKDSLFKKHKKPKKKVKKNTFLEEKQKQEELKSLEKTNKLQHVIHPLTYQMLEEGMVVVGRVRDVLPLHMFVCLPGRLSAKVLAANISHPYTQSLEKLRGLEITHQDCPRLSELFRPGEMVVCSILEVKKEGNVLAVSASLEPGLVNVERSHFTVRAGQTLMAAVASVEDHGYALHTGINGLTTFVRTGEVQRYVEQHNLGRPLVVGEIVRCLVTKCSTSRTASRAEATLDPQLIARSSLKNVTPQGLHPATTVNCTVDRVTPRGLIVSTGRAHGYVEYGQLGECWSSPKNYEPAAEVEATVLYVLPQTNFQTSRPVYLSLKPFTTVVSPRIPAGEVLPAKVVSSGSRGLFLCLGEEKDNEIGNKGFVSIRRLGESVNKDEVPAKFHKGKLVTTRVLGYDYMEQVYNCSLEKSKLEQQYVKVDQLHVGDRVSCVVEEVEDSGLRLAIGPIKLHAFKEHSADTPVDNLHQHFNIGDVVDGRVLKVVPALRQVTVTLKETLIRTPALTSFDMAKIGDSYWGTIRAVHDTSLFVSFYNEVCGFVKSLQPEITKMYKPGQLVKCSITYVNQDGKMLLSLSPQATELSSQLTVGKSYQLVVIGVNSTSLQVSTVDFDSVEGLVPKIHLRGADSVNEGDFLQAWLYLVMGGVNYFSPSPAIKPFLKGTAGNIKLGTKLTCLFTSSESKAYCFRTPIEDFPTANILKARWTREELIPQQIVKLYVEHVDATSNTLRLACIKPGTNADQGNNQVTSNSDLKEAGNLNTSLQSSSKSKKLKVDDKISTDKTKRKRKESLSEDKSPVQNVQVEGNSSNLCNLFDYGECTSNPPQKKKKNQLNYNEEKEVSGSNGELNTDVNNSSDSKPNKKSNKKSRDKLDKSLVFDDNEASEKNSINKVAKKSNSKKLTLSETGFLWDVKPEDLNKTKNEPEEEDLEDDEDTESKKKKKKTPAERRAAAKEEEARLREVEQALLDSETNPQSVDQFDRAVLARPDDGDLWIKYMSHHLQATEIEKARAVARRALQTINQRHEVDRLNVWIALLNLENLFGNQESLKSVLDEALRTNDEYTVYCKMLHIYAQASKTQETEQLVNTMIRKFRSSLLCWVQSCSALMECKLADKARNILQRAITALPTKEHVNLLCKFALLENQHGFSEQAQTLFEHILTSYPKRTDVWSVYVDMLVKSGKVKVARQILERATRQKLPVRKMKMLFSKWISFEEKNGTPDKVEHARKQALAYVNNMNLKLE